MASPLASDSTQQDRLLSSGGVSAARNGGLVLFHGMSLYWRWWTRQDTSHQGAEGTGNGVWGVLRRVTCTDAESGGLTVRSVLLRVPCSAPLQPGQRWVALGGRGDGEGRTEGCGKRNWSKERATHCDRKGAGPGSGDSFVKVVFLGLTHSRQCKVRFASGELEGFEDWVVTRDLACRWGERRALVRDEEWAAKMTADDEGVWDEVTEGAISTVMEASG